MKFVNHACHARPIADEAISRRSVHMLLDNFTGFVVSERHGRTAYVRLRMRIGDEGRKFIQQTVFNRAVKPPAGSPIGINNPFDAVWTVESLLLSDDIFSKFWEIIF